MTTLLWKKFELTQPWKDVPKHVWSFYQKQMKRILMLLWMSLTAYTAWADTYTDPVSVSDSTQNRDTEQLALEMLARNEAITKQRVRVKEALAKAYGNDEEELNFGGTGSIGFRYMTMKNKIDYENIPELEALYNLINDGIRVRWWDVFDDFEEFLTLFLNPKSRFNLWSAQLALDRSLNDNIPVKLSTEVGTSWFNSNKLAFAGWLSFSKLFEIDDISKFGFTALAKIRLDRGLSDSQFLINSFSPEDNAEERIENLQTLFEDIKVFNTVYYNAWISLKYIYNVWKQWALEVNLWYNQPIGTSETWLQPWWLFVNGLFVF